MKKFYLGLMHMFISFMPIVYSIFLCDYVFKLIAQMTLENEKLQCYDNDAN